MSASEKKAYYGRPEVVSQYDAWRFSAAGGQYVNRRELDLVRALMKDLPRTARVLDMPVGTGRLSRELLEDGFRELTGADASPPMLDATRALCGNALTLTLQDAYSTTFPAESFDAAVSLRFSFHCEDWSAILREFARILKPNGRLVFDTIRRSPRGLSKRIDHYLGGTLYTYHDETIREQLRRQGFEVLEQRSLLLLPSFAYRFTPMPLVGLLDRAEHALPDSWLTKCIWSVRRCR
jgi:ubiquinone/menaquinone biosynthesis C-methylase UbiE